MDQQRSGEHRRRHDLAEIFGTVLPETTRDDDSGDERGQRQDQWYWENRPPHHDGG